MLELPPAENDGACDLRDDEGDDGYRPGGRGGHGGDRDLDRGGGGRGGGDDTPASPVVTPIATQNRSHLVQEEQEVSVSEPDTSEEDASHQSQTEGEEAVSGPILGSHGLNGAPSGTGSDATPASLGPKTGAISSTVMKDALSPELPQALPITVPTRIHSGKPSVNGPSKTPANNVETNRSPAQGFGPKPTFFEPKARSSGQSSTKTTNPRPQVSPRSQNPIAHRLRQRQGTVTQGNLNNFVTSAGVSSRGNSTGPVRRKVKSRVRSPTKRPEDKSAKNQHAKQSKTKKKIDWKTGWICSH